MSKCVDGTVIDRDADLCGEAGSKKHIYYPGSQQCIEGQIVSRGMALCDIGAKGKVLYSLSTHKCADHQVIVKEVEICHLSGGSQVPFYSNISASLPDKTQTPDVAKCAVIAPDLGNGTVSLFSHYQKYIKPIQSYSAAILQGEFAPANVKAPYDVLDTQHSILQSTLQKQRYSA